MPREGDGIRGLLGSGKVDASGIDVVEHDALNGGIEGVAGTAGSDRIGTLDEARKGVIPRAIAGGGGADGSA